MVDQTLVNRRVLLGSGNFEFQQHGTSPLAINLSKGFVSCCHEHLTLSLAVTVPADPLKVLGGNLKFPEIAKGIRRLQEAGLYWAANHLLWDCRWTCNLPAMN